MSNIRMRLYIAKITIKQMFKRYFVKSYTADRTDQCDRCHKETICRPIDFDCEMCEYHIHCYECSPSRKKNK
jgi:hypothetical protein